jgi:hypothetical protein
MDQNIEHMPLSDGWKAVIYREWDFPSEVIAAWDRMAGNSGDVGIFVSYGWFENWWKAFGKAGELFVVVILKDDGPKGIFPCRLKADPEHVHEMPGICSLTNDHTCHYDFLVDAEDNRSILSRFVQLILLKYPKSQLYFDRVTTSSPNIKSLTQLLRDTRIPFHQYMQPRAPWTEIESDTKRLLARLPGRLRNTIQRCRKKAEKLGPVSFQVYDGAEYLDEVLHTMFEVEYKSWKGRNGTAVKCDTAVEGFYHGYARAAVARGHLLVSLLRVNDIPVATDYCLRSGSTVFLLKTGYDEYYSHISPSNLLRSEMFAYLATSGYCSLYNFLGECEPWKMEWTQETGQYGWIRIYPKSLRGMWRYMLQYGWKNFLKKFDSVRKIKAFLDRGKEWRHAV